jgi:hypothetical protein
MRRLRHVKLVNDLRGYLAHRPSFGVHEHIGLAIKRLSHREQFANFGLRIRLRQERPMIVIAHAFIDRLRRGP